MGDGFVAAHQQVFIQTFGVNNTTVAQSHAQLLAEEMHIAEGEKAVGQTVIFSGVFVQYLSFDEMLFYNASATAGVKWW